MFSPALIPPIASKTWTKTADRPLCSLRTSVGVWLFAHFVGVPVPWSAAGERVPAVLAFDGHRLVACDLGTTLDHWLHTHAMPTTCR